MLAKVILIPWSVTICVGFVLATVIGLVLWLSTRKK